MMMNKMRRMNAFCLYLILVILFCSIGETQNSSRKLSRLNEISGLLVSFESMTRNSVKQTIILSGDVQLVFNGQYLYCDQATIYNANQTIICDGNVVLQNSKSKVYADSLNINYKTNKAIIRNGLVQSGSIIFEGQDIRQTQTDSFDVINGYYTACNTCPPAWSFSGKSIQAKLGGNAFIKNPIIRFGDVPVFWLPFLIIPLQARRQSGLLIPSMDYSQSGGLGISQKIFWDFKENQDLTFGFKHYSNRGLKNSTNYRYVLTETSRGEMDIAYINDRVFGASDRVNHFRSSNLKGTSADRWFLKYDHYYELPDHFVQKAHLNLISDLQYLRDFPEDLSGHGDPALDNRVSLTKKWDNHLFIIDAGYYINLLKENPNAENIDAIHRFPEIRYSFSEQKIINLNLNFGFDIQYDNFASNRFSYDDIVISNVNGTTQKSVSLQRDNSFDYGDLIRSGQRIEFIPTVSYPFHLGKFDFLPTFSYHQSFYKFAIDPDASEIENTNSRGYLRSALSTRTKWSKIFPEHDGIGYKHELIPDITISAIPWIVQKSHPFFGNSIHSNFNTSQSVSDLDFFGENSLQFDYNDRIYQRNLITFSLTNHLIQKKIVNSNTSYNRVATLRFDQTYDLYEQQEGGKFPLSDLQTLLDIRLDNFETNTLLRYYPYHHVINSSSRLKIKNDKGHFAQIKFTQEFHITEETQVSFSDRTESTIFSAGLSSNYFHFLGEIDYNHVTSNIQAWSYITGITPPGNCWGLKFQHRQVANGDITISMDLLYSFDGSQIKNIIN